MPPAVRVDRGIIDDARLWRGWGATYVPGFAEVQLRPPGSSDAMSEGLGPVANGANILFGADAGTPAGAPIVNEGGLAARPEGAADEQAEWNPDWELERGSTEWYYPRPGKMIHVPANIRAAALRAHIIEILGELGGLIVALKKTDDLPSVRKFTAIFDRVLDHAPELGKGSLPFARHVHFLRPAADARGRLTEILNGGAKFELTSGLRDEIGFVLAVLDEIRPSRRGEYSRERLANIMDQLDARIREIDAQLELARVAVNAWIVLAALDKELQTKLSKFYWGDSRELALETLRSAVLDLQLAPRFRRVSGAKRMSVVLDDLLANRDLAAKFAAVADLINLGRTGAELLKLGRTASKFVAKIRFPKIGPPGPGGVAVLTQEVAVSLVKVRITANGAVVIVGGFARGGGSLDEIRTMSSDGNGGRKKQRGQGTGQSGAGGSGRRSSSIPKKLAKRPLRSRHDPDFINSDSWLRGKATTIIHPDVRVAGDVAAINAGRATRVNSGDFVINGRTYGYHGRTGVLYPRAGPSSDFQQLTRPQFRIFKFVNEFGIREALARKIRFPMSEADVDAAIRVYRWTGR